MCVRACKYVYTQYMCVFVVVGAGVEGVRYKVAEQRERVVT